MDLGFCNGTTHFWSDDSYDYGQYPCPGPAKCPTAARRFREQEESMKQQLPDAVTVKVQIPVKLTQVGQRDRVEGSSAKMTVEFDGSNVVLKSDPAAQAGVDAISFPWAGIEAAIKMLGSLG